MPYTVAIASLKVIVGFQPKHSKQYVDLSSIIGEAIKNYGDDVRDKKFPTAVESFNLPKDVYDDLINEDYIQEKRLLDEIVIVDLRYHQYSHSP